jgi:mutator protein MutT
MKQIHVVAGVLRNPQGHVLLASRTEGRDLAGLWEFPGGKVEAGESPEVALVRELREELGIEATVGASLICVPQHYPGKRLLLDARHVEFEGVPEGLDGQALAWVPQEDLVGYPMPPADMPVVAVLIQPDRYLVTPAPGDDDEAWLASLADALARDVRRVQLRAPGVAARRWSGLVADAIALCRDASAEVLLNGDPDWARQAGVGVHLRSAQLHDVALGAALEGVRQAATPSPPPAMTQPTWSARRHSAAPSSCLARCRRPPRIPASPGSAGRHSPACANMWHCRSMRSAASRPRRSPGRVPTAPRASPRSVPCGMQGAPRPRGVGTADPALPPAAAAPPAGRR